MKFEIAFNKIGEGNDNLLIAFGAVVENDMFVIEIKDFKELEQLENLIYRITGVLYSMIIGFDRPSIFLDKEV